MPLVKFSLVYPVLDRTSYHPHYRVVNSSTIEKYGRYLPMKISEQDYDRGTLYNRKGEEIDKNSVVMPGFSLRVPYADADDTMFSVYNFIDNHSFEATLDIVYYDRERNAICVQDTETHITYNILSSGIFAILKNCEITDGKIYGFFKVAHKGSFFGLTHITDY